MKKDKKAAIGTGAAAVVAGIMATVMTMLGNTLAVEGTYKIKTESDMTKRVVLELPYEQVPNAAFYSLVFNDNEIGISPFGEGFGIKTANILFNPIEGLGVIVYDMKSKAIGQGFFSANGKITLNIKESEVKAK